jgi:hypothetical protein
LALLKLIIIIIEGYYLEDCEDWDLDDIMDLDDENDNQDDTFLGTGTGNTTAELASQARRDTGLRTRSPSPAGSVSSLDEVVALPKKKRQNKQLSNSSQAVKLTLNAVKETMKMMNYGKRKRMDDESSESEDDQKPVLVNQSFQVKDNGHDVLDFKIRNSLRTINAKPDTYYKRIARKVEPQLETVEVDHLTANTVNPRIIKKVHDSGSHLELKYFDAGNITVESRAPKASFSARGGDIQTDLALDWVEPDTVWQCVDALLNYCTTVYSVRRDDYTPWVIMKVLHEIRYFAICKDAKTQKKIITEFVNCIFRKNEANARKKTPPVDFNDALKIAENELKKVGIGGNYYGVEPYSGGSALDKADKEELKKLRGKVATLQRDLDVANRRPKGPPKPTYGSEQRRTDWTKMTGSEKQAMTCREW